MNYINNQRVIEIERKSNLSLQDKAIKLAEETGEVAKEVLALGQAANKSKSAEGTMSALAEECIDTIIVAKSLIISSGLSEEELKEIADRKLNKWESKLNEN
jgi:NTP pyrophosphatase (non-canonical NTP hydrolase)